MKRYRTKDLAAMTTDRLEDLLRSEIAKRPFNDDLIRKIMIVLEERKPAGPVELTEEETADWKNFTEQCATKKKCAKPKGCVAGRKRGILISAIVACLCLVIFALPPALGANNMVDLMEQISSGKIKLFHPGNTSDGYVFDTDNPDLQKLYDAVTEQGVTAPVVPMWLPERYVLTEMKTDVLPTKIKMYAAFTNNDGFVVLSIDIIGSEAPRTIEADHPEIEIVELEGATFYITPNDGAFTVLWEDESFSCSMQTNEDLDICYDILRSIHRKAVN